MPKDVLPPLVSATCSVIKTMSGETVEAGEATTNADGATFGSVSGVISLASETTRGALVMSFDEDCIAGIISAMFQSSHPASETEILEATGEITNIVCGHVKRALQERGLDIPMATPIVVRGHEKTSLSVANGISIPFHTRWGNFALETNLEVLDNGRWITVAAIT